MSGLYIVCEGDSLTAGTGSTNGLNYPGQLARLYTDNRLVAVTNAAVSGETIVQMATQATSQVDACFDARKGTNILILWAGTNDIAGGASAVTTHANVLAYCQARQAVGFKVIVPTMLVRSNFTAPQLTERNTFNTTMRAQWQTYADGIADIAADSRLGDFNDATYFFDTVHLTNTGYAIVAASVKAAITQWTG